MAASSNTPSPFTDLLRAGSMLTLVFYERQLTGISKQHWTTIPILHQVPSLDKDGRAILRAAVDTNIVWDRIPATGRVFIVRPDETVMHVVDYTIPSARSVVMDQTTAQMSIPGVGVMRVAAPVDDFPDYAAMPDEPWFQLNAATDPFVIQIKAKKVAPEDIFRSISRGEYFVYAPTKVFVRARLPVADTPPLSAPAHPLTGEVKMESSDADRVKDL